MVIMKLAEAGDVLDGNIVKKQKRKFLKNRKEEVINNLKKLKKN